MILYKPEEDTLVLLEGELERLRDRWVKPSRCVSVHDGGVLQLERAKGRKKRWREGGRSDVVGLYRSIGIGRRSDGGGATSFEKSDPAEVTGERFEESRGERFMKGV